MNVSRITKPYLVGYGTAQQLLPAMLPLWLTVADLNNDGELDVTVIDEGQLVIHFAEQPTILPNDTPETARALGTVVHFVDQTQTIVPGHEDSYFTLRVPNEAVRGAGDEVMDFSALFEATSGTGLSMEVLDADGNVLGSGERFRVALEQGAELLLHVFGREDAAGLRGAGAYTLVIDVLPQVVSVEVDSLLPGVGGRPGGAINSLVVTLQGDRLDSFSAEDPGNYIVTYAGVDGQFGTGDDRVIPVGGENIEQPVVYNPSANVDITSGLTFPTAVRQTVTLVFANTLPTGSFRVALSDSIQTVQFNESEPSLIASRATFGDHPVVSLINGQIRAGAEIEAEELVLAASAVGDFAAFETGTRFLTQLQNDLQSLLDAILSEDGDDPSVTPFLLQHILDRILPGLGGQGERLTSILLLFFDPPSFRARRHVASGDQLLNYDKQTNTFERTLPNAFAVVGRNADLLVISQASGTYEVDLADVPQVPRFGAIVLSSTQTSMVDLTADLRAGVTHFVFDVINPAPFIRVPSILLSSLVASAAETQSEVFAVFGEPQARSSGTDGAEYTIAEEESSFDGPRRKAAPPPDLPPAVDELLGEIFRLLRILFSYFENVNEEPEGTDDGAATDGSTDAAGGTEGPSNSERATNVAPTDNSAERVGARQPANTAESTSASELQETTATDEEASVTDGLRPANAVLSPGPLAARRIAQSMWDWLSYFWKWVAWKWDDAPLVSSRHTTPDVSRTRTHEAIS